MVTKNTMSRKPIICGACNGQNAEMDTKGRKIRVPKHDLYTDQSFWKSLWQSYLFCVSEIGGSIRATVISVKNFI
jgi:hypothetical protein